MDAKTCLQKLQYVGVLAFATVDAYGNPQVRNISAIHYEPDALYFFTAKGKDFCKELLADGRVQILGYTKYKEMIRLSARAVPAHESKQKNGWTQYLVSSPIFPTSIRAIPEISPELCSRSKTAKLSTLTSVYIPFSEKAIQLATVISHAKGIKSQTIASSVGNAKETALSAALNRELPMRFSRNIVFTAGTALRFVRWVQRKSEVEL